MRLLKDLELFILAADSGSLSAAARQLDLTPAAASAAIKRLEEDLDFRLFIRSTRSLRLTREGEAFLECSRQGVQLITEGHAAMISGANTLRGSLQISAPSDLGRNRLLPWLDEFQDLHPQVQLRLELTDRLADVYRHPVDVAIRYGQLPDSSLVALPLCADNRRVLCASPAYIARFGGPASPQDLIKHNCLCYMLGEYVYDRWRFYPPGRELSVQVQGNRMSADGDGVRRWAVAGRGIAYKSFLDVAEDIHAGRLQVLGKEWVAQWIAQGPGTTPPVLPAVSSAAPPAYSAELMPCWYGEAAPLNLICADRRQISPVIQALKEFLQERCRRVLATSPWLQGAGEG